MRRTFLVSVILAAALAAAWLRPAAASDEDKARLFNMFYLNGDQVTYVLILRENRTFDLYHADGRHASGTLRADDEYVTLTAEGGVKRMFRYSFKGRNLRLGCRRTDKPVEGDFLGEMPPVDDPEVRTLYLSQGEWLKKGRLVFNPKDAERRVTEVVVAPPAAPRQAPPPAPPPAPVARPQPTPPTPPPAAVSRKPAEPVAAAKEKTETPAVASPVKSVQAMEGKFVYRPNPSLAETLAVTADGNFTYKDSDGASAAGKLSCEGNVLVLKADDVTRRFTATLAGANLTLTRAPGDNTPEGKSDLSSMSPTEQKTATYEKK